MTVRYLREFDGCAEVRAQLARDPFVTQQIGAVRRYVDHDLVIADPHRVDEARSRWGRRVELQDPRVVGAEAEVFRRAEHAVRLDAADLLALELQAAGQYGAHRGVGVDLAGLDVRRAAHHFDGSAPAPPPPPPVPPTEREAIGVAVPPPFQHPRHQAVTPVLVQ